MTGDAASQLAGAQFLDVDALTVGNDVRVNENRKTVHWIAFKAADGEVAIGSYTGDGNDDRTIDISDPSASFRFSAGLCHCDVGRGTRP